MEEHLAVLLRLAKAYDAEQLDVSDLYVWWGKVRSPNRQQPQANLDVIREVGRSAAADPETHLYLTDYRSLYVGEVGGIIEGDLPPGEADHAPNYYAREGLRCDFWFKLHDIRRLVSDDLLAVIEELKKLWNVHYGDRPVSLYGGMVDLPLVVIRDDGGAFFNADERDLLTDGRLWAEFDAETSAGIGTVERALREDMFGDAAWAALETTTRSFIAAAEQIFREHRSDPGFDFASVVGSFGKALEVQCNAIVRRALLKVPPNSRRANVDGRTVDLAMFRPLSLGELARSIGSEMELNKALTAALQHGVWFTGSLPAILDEFREVRNPGAHEARIDRQTATRWRNRLVGVGCVGDFVELARVRLR
jgi:hypothetical protein